MFTALVAVGPTERVEREAWVMGTRLRVTVDAATYQSAVRAAEQTVRAVERTDELLSTWRDDSALSQLNRAPIGTFAKPPTPLLDLLHETFEWSSRTGGAFDPTVGSLIDAWGVRGEPRVPSATEITRALASTGADAIRLDADAGAVSRTRKGVWIDAGAFGKGAALRAVGTAIQEEGVRRALVDLGGQVLALGDKDEPWPLDVAHPGRRSVAAVRLHLAGVSAATSGASERPGHLLDPRSGRTVAHWGSVTVVDADPLVADILSTALYVLGPEDGLPWASREAGIAALFLTLDHGELTARWTPAMRRWLEPPHGN